jgi:glycosyltransferase involved in cell wall biosynthesis
MKFSIVTISFNQAEFLERTIRSLLEQQGVEIEYIVVDPGSTDGSREIIERYRDRLAHVIFEKDQGPADGLNKGFAVATGEVFGYLNSDDTFEPDALGKVAGYFDGHRAVDAVTGHCWITDRYDNRLRKAWSEPFTRLSVAYGAAVQIQPSTFIRKEAFRRTKGFNIENRSSWDGELMVDLFVSGAKIEIIDEFLSCYRLHEISITNSGALHELMEKSSRKRFEKLMGREWTRLDPPIAYALRAWKHLRRPRAFAERLVRGPIYRRGVR